jgi:hypothetical protein
MKRLHNRVRMVTADNPGRLGLFIHVRALETMVELNPIEADLPSRIVQQTADWTSPWASRMAFQTQQSTGKAVRGRYAKARRGSVAGGTLGSR